ncbi:RNA/RNP complex-1-interacting phosphatase like [Pseudolycoriella hygida]|uniref:RNA/RNP complex-1-interacting phosphatase like n=1 Tax=Pseudolycoriella hygida TaxID=35572 RepID=A0A9Q0S8H9_9DIPT|nr:RNA/RNP complex-1-interacting phosphatase like [Pseudolycoriella hygida]
MKIPDRWNDYSSIGRQIEGTRFIAFKVPLDNSNKNAKFVFVYIYDINFPFSLCFRYSRLKALKELKELMLAKTKMRLVIDLTNTKKYYNPKNVTDKDIEYKKIFVPGHQLPPRHIYEEFMNTVADFLRRNAENDKLIGVHCTHGLNRTGLMVCAYMIRKCNILPNEAISRFETARGHKMERENYIDSLRNMKGLVKKARNRSSKKSPKPKSRPNDQSSSDYSKCPPNYQERRPNPAFVSNYSNHPLNPGVNWCTDNANYRPNQGGAYFANSSTYRPSPRGTHFQDNVYYRPNTNRRFSSNNLNYAPHPYGTVSSSYSRYPNAPGYSQRSIYNNRPTLSRQGNSFKD